MPDPKYKISQQVLNDFSATVEAKPELSTSELFEKFPEFNKDTSALQSAMDYYATSKSGKYKSLDELNSKFPEFGLTQQAPHDQTKSYPSTAWQQPPVPQPANGKVSTDDKALAAMFPQQKAVTDNAHVAENRSLQNDAAILKFDKGVKDAAMTVAKARLKAQGKAATPQGLDQEMNNVKADLKSGKLSANRADDGTVSLGTGAGFWDGVTQSVANSLHNLKYAPALLKAHISGDDKGLADIAEEMATEKAYINNHPYQSLGSFFNTTPAGTADLMVKANSATDEGEKGLSYNSSMGSLGQTVGGGVANLAPMLIPGAGEAEAGSLLQQVAANTPRMIAGGAQTYLNAVPERFLANYQENKANGLTPEQAAGKAVKDAEIQGILPAIAGGAFFSGAFGGGSAAKGFGEAIGHAVKNGAKFSTLMGAQAGADDFVKQLQGYKSNYGEDISEAMKGGFLQTAAMELLPHALSLPKYAKNQLYNFVSSNMERPAVEQQLQNAPEGTAATVLKEMQQFDEAKQTIPGNIPVNEETKAAIAGKTIEKAKLKAQIAELSQHGDAYKDHIEALDKQVADIDATINNMSRSNDPFLHETDNLTGERLHPVKTYEDLSSQEKGGIVVPKEYGKAEVVETGEGENKSFRPYAAVNVKKGGLVMMDRIMMPMEKFADKAKAQEVADKALAQHYYENELSDNQKPLKNGKATQSSSPIAESTGRLPAEPVAGKEESDNGAGTQSPQPVPAEEGQPAEAGVNQESQPAAKEQAPINEPTNNSTTGAPQSPLQPEAPLPEGQVPQSGVPDSPETTGRGNESPTAPVLNEAKPVEYTTQSGKYKVTHEGVIDVKTGKEPSRSTVKKAISEAADNYDFTAGKPSPEEPDVQINSADDHTAYRIGKTTKPSELADIYINEQPVPVPLNTKEQMIAEYGVGKVKTSSFDEYNDRNNRSVGIAKSYLDNSKGRPLDSIAEEISGHHGIEITPQDIADFMVRFPNGVADALKTSESGLAAKAKAKFRDLTGFDLNSTIAEKAIDQEFKKLSDEQQRIAEQDFANREELEAAYWNAHDQPDDAAKESTDPETQQAASPEEPAAEEKSPPVPPAIETPAGERGDGGSSGQVGVHHAALTELSNKLGLAEPQRGEYIQPEEYAKRGRALLEGGADPNEVNNPNNALHDRIAIGRAHLEDLVKSADDVARHYGVDSEQYKQAAQAASDYANNTVKPLGTEAHRAMVSLQGTRDIDTGSFTTVKQQVEATTGKPATAAQEVKIKDLTEENTRLKQEAQELEKQLVEATDKLLHEKEQSEPTGKSKGKYSKAAKDAADKFRQLKAKPFTFKDENGNEIPVQMQGLGWNDLVEAGAKVIEATGKIADGVAEIVDKVKDADWYKNLSDAQRQSFAQQLYDHFQNAQPAVPANPLADLQQRFLNKKDTVFSADEAKAIWDYTKKTYLDNGTAYRDAISFVANDLGLSWRQVSEAFISPKQLRLLSDAMWKKQADLRKAQNATKHWIENQSKSTAYKALIKTSGFFREAQVFGHGGIFVGTHAGMTFMMPSTWDKTLKAFVNGWKFAYFNKAGYERSMEELKNRPNYVIAQRAGVKNNPDRVNVEEYQKNQHLLGDKLGGAGERGFNAIKVLRQDIFDFHFNRLSAAEQADPEVHKSIARLVNNATGATNLDIPEWVNEVTFAGGMEASRWGKLTRNPLEATSIALRTLYNADNVSAADKVFAKVWARRVGEQLVTFGTTLAINAAFQNAFHPNNKTNMTDPDKPDFLKFKFGAMTIDPTSGMLGAFNFMRGMAEIPFKSQKELGGDTRMQAFGKAAAGYTRGKAAPLYSTVMDFATQTDFNGNPMPFSNDKPRVGKHKLDWLEYGWQKAPLPVAEAAKVAYQAAEDAGADKVRLNNILYGVLSGGISGGSGFRVGEYEEKADQFDDKDKQTPVFKYFLDKGLDLPITSLQAEKLTDHKAGTVKTIADYPKEQQDQYQAVHKEELKKVLAGRLQYGVYVTTLKDKEGKDIHSVALKAPDNMHYTRKVPVNALDKEELTQLLSAAQSMATTRAKHKVFKVK